MPTSELMRTRVGIRMHAERRLPAGNISNGSSSMSSQPVKWMHDMISHWMIAIRSMQSVYWIVHHRLSRRVSFDRSARTTHENNKTLETACVQCLSDALCSGVVQDAFGGFMRMFTDRAHRGIMIPDSIASNDRVRRFKPFPHFMQPFNGRRE